MTKTDTNPCPQEIDILLEETGNKQRKKKYGIYQVVTSANLKGTKRTEWGRDLGKLGKAHWVR